MKPVCVLLLAAGAALAADEPRKDDASAGDLARLRGTWVIVSLVNNGQTVVDEKTPPKEGPATKLVYDGTKWMIKVGDRTVANGVFAIDATKNPKQIDV